MRHRPRFRLHHLAPLADNVRRTLTTMLMMETPLLILMLPVTRMPVSEMQTPMVMMVPMMDTGAGHRTIRLGEPLRGRAFRSNLRFAPISAAIPLASVRVRSPPSAACFARLPAAPAAPPATQSPWRLHSAGFPGVDSPIAHTAGSAVLTARGGLGFHT